MCAYVCICMYMCVLELIYTLDKILQDILMWLSIVIQYIGRNKLSVLASGRVN